MTDIFIKVGADEIEERDISGIIKAKLIKNIATPCDYFECMICGDDLMDDVNFISLYKGDNRIFKGIVDKKLHSISQSGRTTSIFARSSIGAYLVDNEAMPRVYNYPKLSLIASIHGYQYGIKGIKADSDRGLPFFTVVKGISEWDVLELYVRQTYGVLPYIDADNYLVAQKRAKGTTIQVSNTGSDSLRYSSINISQKPYKKLSHIYICKDDGTYSLVQNKDAGITRRRQFYVPSNQWVLFPRWSVGDIIAKSMDDSFSVEVELPGYVDLQLGDDLVLSEFYPDGKLLEIREVEFVFSERIFTRVIVGDCR